MSEASGESREKGGRRGGPDSAPLVLVIRLPWPPSVNTYWRHSAFGGGGKVRRATFVHLTNTGRRYQRDASFAVARQVWPARAIEGTVAVEIEAYPPDNRRRDLDNILKPLFDVLVKGKALVDDVQVRRLVVEESAGVGVGAHVARLEKGTVRITVRPWEVVR